MKKEQLYAMAQRIKQKRMSLRLTQEQISERLKISYSSYTKIENGFLNPSLDTLISISLILKISMDELVFGEVDDENNAQIRALITTLKSHNKESLDYTVEMLKDILSCL